MSDPPPLQARGLIVETSDKPPDNPSPAHFDPECAPESSLSSVPLLVLRLLAVARLLQTVR